MAPHIAHDPQLLDRVKRLPDQPGVYLFRDAKEQVIYIGKALSLRKRVGSYFHSPVGLSPRIHKLISLIRGVDYQTTNSEAEALLLESTLIKAHLPKYNVAYRDDKAYPLLKLTDEPFPRLLVARRKKPDGARYFGPYADATLLRQARQFLKRVFPLRTCRRFPKSPCLEYHLGQCLAPCVGYIDEKGYARIVEDLIAFLEGKRDALLKDLSKRMAQAARDQRFEDAAKLRDQVQALTSIIVAKEKSAMAGPLEQLQSVLRLASPPCRIEAFDISNIFGRFAVGSMVTFVDGKPSKAHYRRFKIETVQGIDDYQMMREVVRRRYSGTLAAELPWPDLILIDGGKGQLGAALEELKTIGRSMPILGLAKREEQIFVPGQSDPIVLLPTSPVLHLMQHIRDEAHRFAISYHRRLRAKPIRASLLDAIAGIGPKRKARLLKHFGSLRRLVNASVDEVAQAGGLSEQQAASVLEHLTGQPQRRSPSS